MSSATLFTLIILAIATTSDSFSWSDCGLRNATVHFKKLEVKPTPIRFARPLTMSGEMFVDQDVAQGARSQVTVWRVVNLFWTWPFEVRVS